MVKKPRKPAKPGLRFRTDHYKFYQVEVDRPPGILPVLLAGQFERRGAKRRHSVRMLTHFGNPVSKNREPIHD